MYKINWIRCPTYPVSDAVPGFIETKLSSLAEEDSNSSFHSASSLFFILNRFLGLPSFPLPTQMFDISQGSPSNTGLLPINTPAHDQSALLLLGFPGLTNLMISIVVSYFHLSA